MSEKLSPTVTHRRKHAPRDVPKDSPKDSPQDSPKKEWKRGPESQKVQITVRLQKELMDVAYAMMKRTNMRITDMLERGLLLAMEEEERLPLLGSQVRFLVANTTREQQNDLRDYLTFLRIDEVREPSETEKSVRGFIERYLKSLRPWRQPVIDLYSRYGRTETQIEKLTG